MPLFPRHSCPSCGKPLSGTEVYLNYGRNLVFGKNIARCDWCKADADRHISIWMIPLQFLLLALGFVVAAELQPIGWGLAACLWLIALALPGHMQEFRSSS